MSTDWLLRRQTYEFILVWSLTDTYQQRESSNVSSVIGELQKWWPIKSKLDSEGEDKKKSWWIGRGRGQYTERLDEIRKWLREGHQEESRSMARYLQSEVWGAGLVILEGQLPGATSIGCFIKKAPRIVLPFSPSYMCLFYFFNVLKECALSFKTTLLEWSMIFIGYVIQLKLLTPLYFFFFWTPVFLSQICFYLVCKFFR